MCGWLLCAVEAPGILRPPFLLSLRGGGWPLILPLSSTDETIVFLSNTRASHKFILIAPVAPKPTTKFEFL